MHARTDTQVILHSVQCYAMTRHSAETAAPKQRRPKGERRSGRAQTAAPKCPPSRIIDNPEHMHKKSASKPTKIKSLPSWDTLNPAKN